MVNSKLIIPRTAGQPEGPIVTSNIVLHLDAATYSGGNNWLDLSGRNKHASIYSATFDGSNAFYFNGTSDHMIVGDLGVAMNQYTIQIWYNAYYPYHQGNAEVINMNSAYGNIGPKFVLNNDFAESYWIASGDFDESNFDFINIDSPYLNYTWQSASLTLNSSGEYSSYLDGIPITINAPNGSGVYGSFEDIVIGGDIFQGKYFQGKLSKILIYNVALNSQQILDNHNTINPRFL